MHLNYDFRDVKRDLQQLPYARHAAAALALIALAGICYVGIRRVTRRRQLERSLGRQPEPLQVWEGEGGGVPVGGSRTAAARVRGGEAASSSDYGMASGGNGARPQRVTSSDF
jgi:hypothetical protein